MVADGGSDHTNPDAAWRALGLMNDWIKHADAKAGITLAATGTAAVILFNLTRSIPPTACWPYFAPPVGAVGLLLAAAYCAAKSLVPRTSSKDGVSSRRTRQVKNPLFYGDVAKTWDRESYIRLMSKLAVDDHRVVEHLGAQIHVNADIASTKFRWADRAIRLLGWAVLALITTGAVGVITR